MNTLKSAFQYAEAGKIEEWVHLFLNGEGDNVPFSDGLRLENRRYFGPLKLKLDMFVRCCGPEANNKYVIDREAFEKHVSVLQNRFKNGWDMPPLIVNYCNGIFELNDGNHRYEALKQSGVDKYFFIVWTTAESDAINFSKELARCNYEYNKNIYKKCYLSEI